jgi:UDP-N-acetylglucosamine--N-acetylmuramyl-(pentapeptide) pyrophosphoryl-undecaprenol N-acetylglucosamine transferase
MSAVPKSVLSSSPASPAFKPYLVGVPGTTTILFAGGGTGGHLFPALAIAEQVVERAQGTRVRFLCSDRPLDAEILKAERLGGGAVEFGVIPAKPFGSRPLTLAKFVWSWGGAVRAGREAIAAAKKGGPVWVVAGGGFVAAPVVQAARAEKVPVLMLNLDAVPGRANRWIARHAKEVVTTVCVVGHGPKTGRGTPWQSIPPIVRRAAVANGSAQECRAALGLDPQRPTIFVTGASQGAQSINRFMGALAKKHSDELRRGGWQVLHQTGKFDEKQLREEYESAGVPHVIAGFFREMGQAWGAADIAVSRAGAGSVAEAWANHVPTVFLPYPYHKDEHQKHNAAPLVNTGGAVLVKDHIDPAKNVEDAGAALMDLVRDPSKRGTMRTSLAELGPADGARRVAEMLVR